MLQLAIIGLSLISSCFGHYELPADLKLGAVTAAFPIEGGWNEGGKGESSWDFIVHNYTDFLVSDLPPEELIAQAKVAADSYHNWREDIRVAKELGLDYYKFSIATTRIIPRGPYNPVNQEGIDYYNNLIDGLLAVGITPVVTMYYYDGSQAASFFYGGFSNPLCVDAMVRYADVLFAAFGDRVKIWDTFQDGYKECKEIYGEFIGNEYEYFPRGEYEYLCGRYLILSHASIYRLYQDKYKAEQNGLVSMTFGLDWYEPADEGAQEAALRAMDFTFGWFASPIINGDYPQRMIDTIAELSEIQNFPQSRLPPFTEEEKVLIKGALDLMVLVHRNTYLVVDHFDDSFPPTAQKDVQITRFIDQEWNDTNSFYTTTPWGFREAVKYVWDNYGQPEIAISHATYGAYEDSLNDDFRIHRLQQFLQEVTRLIHEDGVNIKYFSMWSLIDSFFFQYAYTAKFGLYHVDFNNPARPRTPKQSASYYRTVIETRIP
ncbi:unnamed protein product [Ceutorhynchus assimilis]|uniref:Myrosinase 1-like n=1 Tax=Ceutorhynchus assimilis TaxID=467358 RepID=A0A9P0GM84_9CUCU|nr:unnamed protein product [Ceutorhynchus assimilis]